MIVTPPLHALSSDNAAVGAHPTRLGDALFCATVALSLAGYPLVSAIPELTGMPTREVSVPYRALCALLALLAIGISMVERTNWWPRKFALLFAAFWLMYLVRLVNDTVLESLPLGFPESDYWLFTLGITAVPSIAFARRTAIETLERAARWAVVVLIIATGSNLWVGWDVIESSTDLFRFGTESVNPIAVGTVGSRLFLLTLLMVLRPALFPGWGVPATGRKAALVLCAVGLPLGAAALLFSGSRGPVVATLACAAIMLYLLFRRSRNRVVIPAALVSLIALVVAIVLPFVVNLGGSVLERFYLTSKLQDLSDVDRFLLWENGWNQFLDSPLLGSGIEEMQLHFYPHNLPLEAFMATGIFGGLLFLWLGWISIRSAFRLIRSAPGALWLPLLYIDTWIIALFSGSIWGAATLIHLMVAVVVLDFALGTVRTKRGA